MTPEGLFSGATVCDEAELMLESRPESIRRGRQFVADTLIQWGFGADEPARARLSEIVLVASELLTNAVRVSPRTTSVRVEAHRDHVLVAVRDDSAAPATPRKAGLNDTSGRGLSIVDALSERWGTTPTGSAGKVVWSKIAISAPSALMQRCRL
jgi:signal transduction histidine kinase